MKKATKAKPASTIEAVKERRIRKLIAIHARQRDLDADQAAKKGGRP